MTNDASAQTPKRAIPFRCCPACGSALAAPETPEENPDDPSFQPFTARCSASNASWIMCERLPDGFSGQSADAPSGAVGVFLREVGAKIAAGELGLADAAVVITVDSRARPPRIGSAAHRLDSVTLANIYEGMAKSLRAGERASKGGIIIPGRT